MTEREFKDTYMPLADGLYRVAFYLLESEVDARDAVQDLYVKLWNSRDSLDSIHNPKAYCITLIRNLCLDRMRRLSSNKSLELNENILSENDTGQQLESKERLKLIIEAMNEKLSENQRKVLIMRTIEDLSYEEISQRTGMNGLTLRVLISQARSKLKKVL